MQGHLDAVLFFYLHDIDLLSLRKTKILLILAGD